MAILLKACSFNVRCECDKTPNSFPERAPLMLDLIAQENPDVIGFQEVSNGIQDYFRQHLTDTYLLAGCGRNADLRGEAMLVAYKKDVFECEEVRNFWLSATPDVPGSNFGGDQSSCPRMATAVRLKHHDSAQDFWFVNTHLDHKGEQARLFGAMELLQFISSLKKPYVLTGDMNAFPDAPEIKLLTDFGSGDTDATTLLDGTFHNYGRLERPVKIDYVFTDLPHDKRQSYMVPAAPNENGTYPSDHCPIFAYVTLQ